MTTSNRGPQQGIADQLRKLQHLAQPFFLPLEQANGWQFIWLLVSLLFCVGGLVLLVLTGLVETLESLQPALTEKYFGGVSSTIDTIWSSWWGGAFSALFLLGAGSFFALRQELRNRRWLPWLLLGIIVPGDSWASWAPRAPGFQVFLGCPALPMLSGLPMVAICIARRAF